MIGTAVHFVVDAHTDGPRRTVRGVVLALRTDRSRKLLRVQYTSAAGRPLKRWVPAGKVIAGA